MEINRDEKWLVKLKDSLGNWQEPAPADFWSNLQKDMPQAGAAGETGGRRPARYLYWTAVAAAVLLAAFLFVQHQEEALPVTPGTKIAQNEPVPEAEQPLGTKTAQNEPVPVAEQHLDTKTTQNEPVPVAEQPSGTKTVQNEPVPVAEQILGTKTTQNEPVPVAEQPSGTKTAQNEPGTEPQLLKETIREALYLAEEKPERKKWIAFSAGNGAFSAPSGFLKGESSVYPVQDDMVMGNMAASGDEDHEEWGGGSGTPELDLQQGQILGITNLGIEENRKVVMVGGSNFYSFRSKEVYRSYKYSHRQPVRLGVSFAMEVTGRLFLESGLTYEYLGSTMKGNGETLHQNLHYLGVPLKANIYFSKGDRFSLYAGAGFLLERCVYGTIGGERINLSHWQKSLSASIGAQIFLGGHAYLYLEPGASRYLGMDEEVISMQKGYMIKTLHSEEPFGITISGGVRILF
ncbi:MAG: hypothetical protein IJ383_01885 [Bacteroidales bacterium]|nr:hypothetical protein [Bacteroidales bacterium]